MLGRWAEDLQSGAALKVFLTGNAHTLWIPLAI